MDKIKIDRINELAKKAKHQDLSPAEKSEQKKLRRDYLDAVKKNLKAQLDHIHFNKHSTSDHSHGNCQCKSCQHDH